MMFRTTQRTVVFARPFLLARLGAVQPAGTYTVETNEELIPTLLTSAYRRVSTFIYLHERPGDATVTGIANIEPEELEAALALDSIPLPDPD